MQPIYTQTVSGSSTSGIQFNNIPQGFADLLVIVNDRSNFSGAYTNDLIIYPNTNSDSLSSSTTIFSNASTASSGRLTSFTGWWSQYGNAGLSSANTYANASIYIANYTNATFKTAIVDSVTEDNSASNVAMTMNAHLWRVTDPITSLYMSHGGQNFTAGSTFTLYGISNSYDTRIPIAPTIGTVTDQSGFVSVDFTRASGDQAESYRVTSTPSGSTTYGITNPIITPAVLGTSYTYQVASVNSLGSGVSAASSALTTDNSYASIATVPFTNSTTSSASFLNIPQNYKHLQLRCFVRMTSSQSTPYDLTVTVNGSNATNYSYHTLRGDGANPGSTGLANDNVFRFPVSVPNSFMTSNVFGVLIIDMPDYRDQSKFKTVRALWGYDNTSGASPTAGWTGNTGSSLQSTEAISSLIVASFGNFAQNSHIALYGIA